MVREPIERLKEKVLKENLWVFIFKILKEKDEYAYEIRKKIKKELVFWQEMLQVIKFFTCSRKMVM